MRETARSIRNRGYARFRRGATPRPAPAGLFLPTSGRRWHNATMLPDRFTIILAAAGATLTLGERHPATVALSRASETMDKIDLWQARLAMKTLRKDQREAIAEAVES